MLHTESHKLMQTPLEIQFQHMELLNSWDVLYYSYTQRNTTLFKQYMKTCLLICTYHIEE